MTTNQRNLLKGFTRVELVVTLVAIAALAIFVISPFIFKSAKKSPQTAATNNLRQVGLAMFEFETAYSTKDRPDNDYGTAREMLKKGEVGFGYIMRDADFALSKEGHLERALVVTPQKYHGSFEAGKFDKNICDSKAVMLRLDNSVIAVSINSNDEAVLEGKSLLQTGPDTIWGEVATPVIKNPLPK